MKTLLQTLLLFFLIGWNMQTAHSRSAVADTLIPDLSTIEDERVLKLLISDPVFNENWINDITFPYENFKVTELPEITAIPLMRSGEKFTPTWYGKLSSGYKWRWGRQHHGVDLALKTGDTVYAAWDGIVRYAQWNRSGYGNCVVIRHRNGLETLYAHLSKIQVVPNQYISSGEVVGLGGNTGRSFGAHLHFEIRYKDFSIDPESVIDYNTRQLRSDTLSFVKSNIRSARYSSDMSAIPASSTTDSIQIASGLESHDSTHHSVAGTFHPNADTEQKMRSTGSKRTETAKKKSAPGKKATQTYTIKKGDTYTSISKKTGVSISALKKLNPRQKETMLMPGKKIRIR